MNISYDTLQEIEEISLNSWPSLQQILYDGWILRFANGYTKRANSINPIYASTENIYRKIEECKQIYSSKNLNTIFRITPFARPKNLDRILADAGFEKKDTVSVRVLDLDTFQTRSTNSNKLNTEISQEWLNNFVRLNNVSRDGETLSNILNNIVSQKCSALLIKDDRVVTCGLGVLERQYVGLFEIVTAKAERRKGFGRELILNILDWAKQSGAKKAYLQVVMSNESALRLYSKLGFEEVYKYFYRIDTKREGKPVSCSAGSSAVR